MIKKFSLKELYNSINGFNLGRDAFVLFCAMIFIISFIMGIVYTFFYPIELQIYIAVLVTCLVSVLILFGYYKKPKHEMWSIILLVYLNLYFLPEYMAFGRIELGEAPIWFAAISIGIFFMLDLKKYWLLALAIFYWHTLLYVAHYIWNPPPRSVVDPTRFFLGMVSAFIFVSIGIVLIIALQERNLNRVRQAIEKSRESENNAGLAKSRFLANMSHEIRTPMNSIIGLSELILKDDMDDATRQEVTIIKDAAYDLLDIIDNVLLYSKLDSQKMSLITVDFEIEKLIRKLLDSVALHIQDKNLKMRIHIDHNIPKVLKGDDLNIRNIITRLIFISLQLTENGRIMISLDSKPVEDGKKVCIYGYVADTGMGLSQADLDAVYGAYDTYDSKQSSNLKGISLKFSICRELLKMMGGNLEISSIEGVGLESKFSFVCDVVDPSPMITLESKELKNVLIYVTDERELGVWKSIMEGFSVRPDYVNSYFSFDKAIQGKKYDYIFLPSQLYSSVSNILTKYSIEEDTYVICGFNQAYGDFNKCKIVRHPVTCISIAEVLNGKWKEENYIIKSDSETYDGSRARILVVDDNNVNLKVAMGIFKHYKINIDVAKSGEECLKKMEYNSYHLVLMDLIMPEMSGKEALQRIRASENPNVKDVPVVALTATTGNNMRDELLDEGFQEYLAKPIKQKYLLTILKEFLPPEALIIRKKEDKKTTETVKDLTKEENVLQTAKGIANIGFNEDSYCAILNTYYSEGMRKLKDLPNLLEAGDISLFTTNVHGIKSSSASIGAMTVSEMFKELEFAGKANDINKINDKYEAYVEAFKKILGDVKEYLLSKNRFEYKEETASDARNDAEEEKMTSEMLAELKDFIDKMNLKECDRLIEDYGGRNFGEEMNQKISAIKKAYEMFDFHTVKQLLNETMSLVDIHNP